MKFSALTLSTVAVMAIGVTAQANGTDAGNSTTPSTNGTDAGNSTTPSGNTTAPGTNGTNGTSPSANGTDAPKPTTSSPAFAIAAGSEGIVAAGVFAGLLAALV